MKAKPKKKPKPPKPKLGDKKVTDSFVILPTKIEGYWVWLEPYSIVSECDEIISVNTNLKKYKLTQL